MRARYLLFAAAALLASGCVPGHGGHRVRDVLEETRSLSPEGRFALENVNGSVEVDTWDRDEVRIEAERAAASESLLEDVEVEISGEGDRVEVRTRLPEVLFFGSAGSVEYHITVPRRARLELESVNGAVRVYGVEGEVQASTVNGRVRIEGSPASVEASTVNGSVEATYERAAVGGRHRYSTTNGSVTLRLPIDTAGRFEVDTVNGGIRSELPLEVTGKIHKRVDDRIGEGGGDYEISTVNGSIEIRES